MDRFEYAWRDGARLQKGARVAAQAAGERLEQLRAAGGGELTPEAVVADARHSASPLHPLFEWDEAEAAHQYRLVQARALIRSVVVRYRAGPGDGARRVVAFVNVKDGDRQYYTTSAVALSDPARRAIVLRQAWEDFQALRRRYADLVEFSSFFAALDEIEAALPPVAA
ncbi:hypothetical protein EDC22_1053 [Tepidamorphus gemmatus]|uniref:Uncharacterized protein n=1 Tax=Tepidamorphus gemmatus TaxID=747076 RepID=A0A4R3MB30_9HYPH|nr:hypothetical protein [Tepidamorphus gemmatus]TCT10506.1 hypothetical protein EDC22_1053 [Tepidamorphus gemmatus]